MADVKFLQNLEEKPLGKRPHKRMRRKCKDNLYVREIGCEDEWLNGIG
jgi:hypothetical protein